MQAGNKNPSKVFLFYHILLSLASENEAGKSEIRKKTINLRKFLSLAAYNSTECELP